MALAHKTQKIHRAGSGWPIFRVLGPALVVLLLGPSCTSRPETIPLPDHLVYWFDGTAPEVTSPGEGPGLSPETKAMPSLTTEESRRIRRVTMEKLTTAAKAEDLPPQLRSLWRALNYLNQGKNDHAAIELKDHLGQFPGDFMALVWLANVRIRQKTPTLAVQLAELALMRAPEDGEAALILAQGLVVRNGKGDLPRAEAILKSVSSPDITPGRIQHLLIEVLVKQGNLAEALSIARKGVESAPDYLPLRRDLVTVLLQAGEVKEAYAACRVLVEPPQEQTLSGLWLFARVCRRAGEFTNAYKVYGQMLNRYEQEKDTPFAARISRPMLEQNLARTRKEREEGRRIFYFPGEVFDILRADKREKARIEVISALALQGMSGPDLARAFKLALLDPAVNVRVLALKLLQRMLGNTTMGWDMLVGGLGDQAPEVRGLVARLLGSSRRSSALAPLIAAMEKEQLPYPFVCLNKALSNITKRDVLLLGEEKDPQSRARIVREWKEFLKK